MDFKDMIGLAASLIGLIGIAPYIFAIVKGRVRPHGFSWFIWTTIVSINAAAQLSAGAGAGAYTTIMSGVLCLIVTLLSLKYGEKHITRMDKASFVAALAAIPLWVATRDPLWSVLLVCCIDIAGLVPTWRKSWFRPHEEGLVAFWTGALSFAVGLAALEAVSATTVLYPLTLIIANTALCVMVLLRRKRLSVA